MGSNRTAIERFCSCLDHGRLPSFRAGQPSTSPIRTSPQAVYACFCAAGSRTSKGRARMSGFTRRTTRFCVCCGGGPRLDRPRGSGGGAALLRARSRPLRRAPACGDRRRPREALCGARGAGSCKHAGHSLRAGFVSSAVRAGKTERAIKRQTGHTSSTMVNRYVRELEIQEENATKGFFEELTPLTPSSRASRLAVLRRSREQSARRIVEYIYGKRFWQRVSFGQRAVNA